MRGFDAGVARAATGTHHVAQRALAGILVVSLGDAELQAADSERRQPPAAHKEVHHVVSSGVCALQRRAAAACVSWDAAWLERASTRYRATGAGNQRIDDVILRDRQVWRCAGAPGEAASACWCR